MTGPMPGYPAPIHGTAGYPGVSRPLLIRPMPAPTLDEVRAWCEVSANVVTDAQLQAVCDAETELQAARLAPMPTLATYPVEMPASLAQALLRRVARELAARGVPLGVTGADEYGPVALPSYDSEIERLEAPWRSIPVA